MKIKETGVVCGVTWAIVESQDVLVHLDGGRQKYTFRRADLSLLRAALGAMILTPQVATKVPEQAAPAKLPGVTAKATTWDGPRRERPIDAGEFAGRSDHPEFGDCDTWTVRDSGDEFLVVGALGHVWRESVSARRGERWCAHVVILIDAHSKATKPVDDAATAKPEPKPGRVVVGYRVRDSEGDCVVRDGGSMLGWAFLNGDGRLLARNKAIDLLKRCRAWVAEEQTPERRLTFHLYRVTRAAKVKGAGDV